MMRSRLSRFGCPGLGSKIQLLPRRAAAHQFSSFSRANATGAVAAARSGSEHTQALTGSWFHQGRELRREKRESLQDIEQELDKTREEIAKSDGWDGKWGYDEVLLLSP